MRFIFDLGHPAHFHLFKNPISTLKELGHGVEIIARDKDCLLELLDREGWSYKSVFRCGKGLIALGCQNFAAFRTAVSTAWRKRADFIVGTSIVAGPAARLCGAKSVVFGEDDAKAVPIFAKLAYPVAHYVVTPDCLKFENYGKKHLTYPGYQELAYLHPNRYQANPEIKRDLGLNSDERYFLIRLVSLTAHHDIGEKGVNTIQAFELLERLAKYGRVFISAEKVVDEKLEKYLLPTRAEKIFDVMAFADMVIGDSQTMCAEAAVLGTPSLRCNTFVGRLSYLEELEHKYGLTKGFLPDDFDKLLQQIDKWLVEENIKDNWQQKRTRMLEEKCDLTDWMVKLFDRLA